MKKLAIVVSLAFASTALACPDMEGHGDKATPKTAEKAKEAPKAKDAPKAAPTKDDTKTAKPAEKTEKKPAEKVSSK